jgi:mlo protein
MVAWCYACFCVWVLVGGRAMADTESTGAQTRELDKTPTWAVAGVCAVIIIISIVLEKVLHKLGTVSVLISALIACEF